MSVSRFYCSAGEPADASADGLGFRGAVVLWRRGSVAIPDVVFICDMCNNYCVATLGKALCGASAPDMGITELATPRFHAQWGVHNAPTHCNQTEQWSQTHSCSARQQSL